MSQPATTSTFEIGASAAAWLYGIDVPRTGSDAGVGGSVAIQLSPMIAVREAEGGVGDDDRQAGVLAGDAEQVLIPRVATVVDLHRFAVIGDRVEDVPDLLAARRPVAPLAVHLDAHDPRGIAPASDLVA